MRLNYPKWRMDYDQACAYQRSAPNAHERQIHTNTITWLLSVRAHIKGKLHRKRARLAWDDLFHWGKWSYEDAAALAANGGTIVVDVNARDQQLFIGDSWKDYVLPEVTEKLYTEPTEPKRYSHTSPPPGYAPCTRADGHEGPCALPLAEPQQSVIRRAVNRALDFLGL